MSLSGRKRKRRERMPVSEREREREREREKCPKRNICPFSKSRVTMLLNQTNTATYNNKM